MLFLPVDFNSVKIDALVDSDAYINAVSERDAERLQQNANQCIINKAPPPPFKIQNANADLEHHTTLRNRRLHFRRNVHSHEPNVIPYHRTSFLTQICRNN